jgi:hypothetical protein
VAPKRKGRTGCIRPASTVVHIIAQANATSPCGYITQNSCSIGKQLNLTYYNSGRTMTTIPQLQLGTTSDQYKCNRRVEWRSPLLLKFTMEFLSLSESNLIRDYYVSQLVSCPNGFYPTGIPMRTRNFNP